MSAGFRLGTEEYALFFFCDPRFSKPQFPQSKMQMQAKDPKGKDYPRNFVSGIGVKGLISLAWLCSSQVYCCCFSHWSNCELDEAEVWLTGRTRLSVLIWWFQVWLWFTSTDLKNEQKLWSRTNFSNLDQLPPWFFFSSLKKALSSQPFAFQFSVSHYLPS